MRSLVSYLLRYYPTISFADTHFHLIEAMGRKTGWFTSDAEAEAQARKQHIKQLFLLTTQTAHWFIEQGFVQGKIDDLPIAKQELYNYQRNSKIFIKALE